MDKSFLLTGAALGAVAVIFGAFGAHSLKQIVSPETLSAFQTGVQYQMYHAIALLAVAVIHERYTNKLVKWAGNCFIAGIIFFSGSLYILTAIKATEAVGLSGIGIVTPIGGLFFIAGWILLFAGVLKKN